MVEQGEDFNDWDEAYGDEMDWELSREASQDNKYVAGSSKPDFHAIRVVRLEEIKPRIESRVSEYCDLLGLDEDRVYLVAKYYGWNQEKM